LVLTNGRNGGIEKITMSLENPKFTEFIKFAAPASLISLLTAAALLISQGSGAMAETPIEKPTIQPPGLGLVEIEGKVVTGEGTYGAPKVREGGTEPSAAEKSVENSLRLLQMHESTRNRQNRKQ